MEELKAKIFSILQEENQSRRLDAETLLHLINVFQQATSKEELVLMLEIFSDECKSLKILLSNETEERTKEADQIDSIKKQIA